MLLAECAGDGPDGSRIKPIQPDASMSEYVAAQNENAFGIFASMYELSSQKEEASNCAFSPLSYSAAVSLTANGASGETLTEMLKASGLKEGGLDAL